jgi:hypothetical protein
LQFTLSNSKPVSPGEALVMKGLGLSNVKKRLAILYPGTHSLNIADDLMSFEVALKVPLYNPDERVVKEKKVYELV